LTLGTVVASPVRDDIQFLGAFSLAEYCGPYRHPLKGTAVCREPLKIVTLPHALCVRHMAVVSPVNGMRFVVPATLVVVTASGLPELQIIRLAG
jgi:hypothetical protein